MTKTRLRSLLFCLAAINLLLYAFMVLPPCLYIAVGCIAAATALAHIQKK